MAANADEDLVQPEPDETTLESRLRTVLEGLEKEVRAGLSGLIITTEGHILARMVRGNVDPRALATAGAFLLAGGTNVLERFTREGIKTIGLEGRDGAVLVVEPIDLTFEELAIVILIPSAVNRLTLRVALNKARIELSKLEPGRRRQT